MSGHHDQTEVPKPTLRTTDAPVRVGVFASGRGSNAQAVERYLAALDDPIAAVTLVVSNNRRPGVFDWAAEHQIPHLRLSPKQYPERPDDYTRDLLDLLDRHRIDLIVLAGYMRKLPEAVVARFRNRILNVHPALLPDFGGKGMYGMNVHEAVIAAGAEESGATVHLADEEYDTGQILAQKRVPVLPQDRPEDLASRVLKAEHTLLPLVVERVARSIVAGEEIDAVVADFADGMNR